MVLYSPQMIQSYNSDPRVPPQGRIPLPTSFRSLEDILRLPLVGTCIGFGDPRQPPSFGFDRARKDHVFRFYWQDRWRVRPRLTLSYGLAYHFQSKSCQPRSQQAGLSVSAPWGRWFGGPGARCKQLRPIRRLAWTVTRTTKPCFVRAPVCISSCLSHLHGSWTLDAGTARDWQSGCRRRPDSECYPGILQATGTTSEFQGGPTHFTGAPPSDSAECPCGADPAVWRS